jgi:dTDP-4-amino-4,6-dideoxygalactose transaminase
MMQLDAIPAAATSRSRALLPVHLYGQMLDTEKLAALGKQLSMPVIEDAAQAIGARDPHGRQIGELSYAACLSFYPTKNLGAAGDAGALVTRDPQLATHFRQMRQHGETTRYQHGFVGGNFRMDALQAAVLDVKLRHLDEWTRQRQAIAAYYTRRFAGTDIIAPQVLSGATHVYHQYVIRAPRRDALREHLVKQGVGCAVYYPRPLHLQECFADLGYPRGAFPNAERASEEVLALPIFPELTEPLIARVADAILAFYR